MYAARLLGCEADGNAGVGSGGSVVEVSAYMGGTRVFLGVFFGFQRLPPARGGTAQKKIIHLANWSQLIHPGPASSLTKFFLVSSQSCVSTLTHYSSELLLPRHQGL